jgi:unsaturated chondroitin disaccharide hydrolase
MIQIDNKLRASDLRKKIENLFSASAPKIRLLEKKWDPSKGSPVFTVGGKYTSRGWTEWTQGFQFGSAILQFDATGDTDFLEIGRNHTLNLMAPHVTHIGVHDHGFNNVSTYGNLLRLMHEGAIPYNEWERRFYELALKCSGAIQAARWTRIADGGGFIYSFNGPHSLFVDTIRSLRALAVSHRLGHVLMTENDRRISLLDRLVQHARATAHYSIFYGTGRDAYDIRGRTAHECVFNVNDGVYRCPNSQQGYSPFSTWTRGLAWAMCGFSEQLEFFGTLADTEFPDSEGKNVIVTTMRAAAEATCDFYLANTPTNGLPYWDTGAPGLAKLGDWAARAADPFNDHEPVDSSAALIAAQGLLRLGKYLGNERYRQAGLTIANAVFDEPYLSSDPNHQGLILHAVYHRPNDWDSIPAGRKIPAGESCMWGDYHALELGVYLLREIENKPYLTFWSDSK